MPNPRRKKGQLCPGENLTPWSWSRWSHGPCFLDEWFFNPLMSSFAAILARQVLMENYLLLTASLEQQNQGRFENMLQ